LIKLRVSKKMTIALTETQRNYIAQELSGMREMQKLLIANEQQLFNQCQDSEIKEHFEDMLEDDQENLGIINDVINNYGLPLEPSDSVKKVMEYTWQIMKSSELSMYEKMKHHEVFKHSQVMCGLILHKAAQIIGGDVDRVISPINTVIFETRAHQEQLKGILEVLGTRLLTGQEPDQGVWGRVQDAIAALSGAIGSAAK
jgi:ferritin-like metal-binding protein YciE